MDTIGALLFIIAAIALIVGLIRPATFSRLFKGNKPTRKKLSLIFGGLIIVSFAILGSSPQASDNAKTATTTKTPAHAQPANTATTTNNAPTTANASNNAPQAATKPSLRQDLAFQGDADYCNGIYKDNGDGTTTWSYDIKQKGELITHLSDSSGHIYRHDVQITDAPNYYSYTAPVAIKDVGEINGVLSIPGETNGHPCNISPQQQPQQAY